MSRNARVWEAPPSLPSADFVSNRIYTDPDIYRAEPVTTELFSTVSLAG